MLCDAAAVNNIAQNINSLREKATTLAKQDGLMDADLAGWKEQQLATLEVGQQARQVYQDKVAEARVLVADGREERTLAYQAQASAELQRQVLITEARVNRWEKSLDDEKKELAELAELEKQEQAELDEFKLLEHEAAADTAKEGGAQGEGCSAPTQAPNPAKLRTKYWERQILVIEAHINRKIEAIKIMNQMTVKVTGQKIIGDDFSKRLRIKGADSVSRGPGGSDAATVASPEFEAAPQQASNAWL